MLPSIWPFNIYRPKLLVLLLLLLLLLRSLMTPAPIYMASNFAHFALRVTCAAQINRPTTSHGDALRGAGGTGGEASYHGEGEGNCAKLSPTAICRFMCCELKCSQEISDSTLAPHEALMQNKSNPAGGQAPPPECVAGSGGGRRDAEAEAERVSPDVKPLARAILSHIVVLWVIRRHWLIHVF